MIVTFYSFKGGVGRSMAVANVAEILADAGYHVIVCDWDLEAPGMERYVFETLEEAEDCKKRRGIMDLLMEYKDALLEPPEPGGEAKVELEAPFHERLRKPGEVTYPIGRRRRNNGSLRLLPAGERAGDAEDRYVQSVQTLNWREFYEKWAGAAYIEFFRKDLESHADIILIDSRTGITEHGGICTHHLADVVVLMTAANDLNIEGTLWLAEDLSRSELEGLRGGRRIRLLPVASRIEQTSQKDELSKFRVRFQSSFAKYLPLDASITAEFLEGSEIPYIPYYAFTERVVARESREERHREFYQSYMTIAQAITRVGIEAGGVRRPPRGGWLRASPADGLTEGPDVASLLLAHREWLESEGTKGSRANLQDLDLSRQKLDEADLRRADLSRVALKGADLWQANLKQANLFGSVLSGANLQGACLDGANLEGADLERADLEGSALRGARLVRTRLRQANLSDCDLEGADLQNAILDSTDLRGSNLTGTMGLTEKQIRNALVDSRTRLPKRYEPDLPEPKGSSGVKYHAFISYSRAADEKLAVALEGAISRYAKPWYKSRILQIFRESSLLSVSLSPALWESTVRPLGESEFMLLLASPEATHSRWVAREVDYWIEHKGTDGLIILLTGGQLAWDRRVGDFDWDKTTALPSSLRYKFPHEPLYIDFRWVTEEQHLSLRHPEFQDSVATIAAILRKMPKDELVGEQIRQVRNAERAKLFTSLFLSVLAGIIGSLLATSENGRVVLESIGDMLFR